MEDKSTKVLKGCGYGCGALTIIVILVAAGSYFFVKSKVDSLEELETELTNLEKEHGTIYNYSPELDGSIKPERIEIFLSLRDTLVPVKEVLLKSINEVTADVEILEEDESFWNIFDLIGSGFGVIPDLLNYYKKRNELLLKNKMGLGEYYYIYSMAYYSWLKRSPGDGPKFKLSDNDSRIVKFSEEKSDENFGENIIEQRKERITRDMNRLFRRLYDNQLNKIINSDSQIPFRNTLEKEINALKENTDRLPWEDGVPEIINGSLLPYKDKLLLSYSTLLNPVELIPIKK